MLIQLLLLAAVSSSGRTAAPNGPPRPIEAPACAIVTRVDVEDALGVRVSVGKEEIEGRSSNCDYAAGGGMVSITVQRLGAKPNLAVESAAMGKEIPQSVIREAPEFPLSFYLDIPEAGTQLHIITPNNEHLMVSILGFGEAPRVSGAAARMARRGLARLAR